MVWGNDPGGCFKVFSIFRPEDKTISPIWAKAWIKGLMPKINIFFWIMLQNKKFTLDYLQKKGINLVNGCSLCKMDMEERNHLCLNCKFSQNVWGHILDFWNIPWVHNYDIGDYF